MPLVVSEDEDVLAVELGRDVAIDGMQPTAGIEEPNELAVLELRPLDGRVDDATTDDIWPRAHEQIGRSRLAGRGPCGRSRT